MYVWILRARLTVEIYSGRETNVSQTISFCKTFLFKWRIYLVLYERRALYTALTKKNSGLVVDFLSHYGVVRLLFEGYSVRIHFLGFPSSGTVRRFCLVWQLSLALTTASMLICWTTRDDIELVQISKFLRYWNRILLICKCPYCRMFRSSRISIYQVFCFLWIS